MKYYSLQIFIACDGKAGFSAPLLCCSRNIS